MMLLIFPVLLIVIAVGSFIWYQQADNDIFRALAITSAIIGIVWVLVLAHWSIQLLSLLILLKLRFPLASPIRVNVNDK
jgi:hypothetical protein